MLNLFTNVYIHLIALLRTYNVVCTLHPPNVCVVFKDVTSYLILLDFNVLIMVTLMYEAAMCALILYQYPNG